LAEDELYLTHRFTGQAGSQHDPTIALAPDDGDLARHDEMKPVGLLAEGDELFSLLESARSQSLDEGRTLLRRHGRNYRRRPTEVRHRVAPAVGRELGGELRMSLGDWFNRVAFRYEQDRGAGCRYGCSAWQSCQKRNFADEPTGPDASQNGTRLAARFCWATRYFKTAVRNDVCRAAVLPLLNQPMSCGHDRRLERFE
jgi:hypothetical protein